MNNQSIFFILGLFGLTYLFKIMFEQLDKKYQKIVNLKPANTSFVMLGLLLLTACILLLTNTYSETTVYLAVALPAGFYIAWIHLRTKAEKSFREGEINIKEKIEEFKVNKAAIKKSKNQVKYKKVKKDSKKRR